MGMEMIMGITLFKESENSTATTIVPVAFPMIAGSGTLTTILSLRAEFQVLNIAIGIAINLIMVFLALRSSGWIQSKIGKGGSEVIRKVFGIILLAIAVKLFLTNLGI